MGQEPSCTAARGLEGGETAVGGRNRLRGEGRRRERAGPAEHRPRAVKKRPETCLERQADSKSQRGFCATWRSLGFSPEVAGSHGGFETDRSRGVRGAPRARWQGGPNKAPQTRGLKQQKLLSHGSGAWRSKVKVPLGLRRTALLQAPLLGSGVPSSCSRGALLAYTPPVSKSLPPHPPFFGRDTNWLGLGPS